MGNVHIIIKPKAYVLAGTLVAVCTAVALVPKIRQSMSAKTTVVSLLKNPSFETVNGKLPASWTGWVKGKDQSSASTVAYAETLHDAHSGKWHGTHYGGSAYNAYTFQIAQGLPKGTYTLRAWVQSTGGQVTARMQAEQFDALGTKKMVPVTQGEQWKQIEITGIQVTKGQCMVGFWSESAGGQWMMFDDVELIKAD